MSEIAAEAFESWVILEIMGHVRLAGYLTEQEIAGQKFLRIDVPEVSEVQQEYTSYRGDTSVRTQATIEAYTRYFGPPSVYAITPVSEAVARAAAAQFRAKPINIYIPPPDDKVEVVPRAIGAGPEEDDDEDFDPEI